MEIYRFWCLVLAAMVTLSLWGCGPQPSKQKSSNNSPRANTAVANQAKPASNSRAGSSASLDPTELESALVKARRGFRTKLVKKGSKEGPPDKPPTDVFQLIKYRAPLGQFSAYVTPDPKDGKRRPAIVWITGGDCNSIGDVWGADEPGNEQSASEYRKAGIVMMFPSLRGGNDNPGAREGFLGEVDDVLAAADYLAAQTYVDPKRIYLGGHSTGGTLVLLVAASSSRFRAVFSFGPVGDPSDYGGQFVYCSLSDKTEIGLRSPVKWLAEVKTPTFVFEGSEEPANTSALDQLRGANTNPLVKIYKVARADHFTVLGPVNRVIVPKVLSDKADSVRIAFTVQELNRPFAG